MGWPWVGGGCGGRGPHARVRATAGSVVPRLEVGCVRVWRRGGVAAAPRVCPSRVLGVPLFLAYTLSEFHSISTI